MIMCNACFRDDKIKTSTTFTVEYKGCIIVVRNVPCLECPICGETTFADEVSERLEKIVNSAKAVLQDISVIDYLKVA
jgi:YgiT-type zinc finger domain-containing protein